MAKIKVYSLPESEEFTQIPPLVKTLVAVEVPANHPLLVLRKNLNWLMIQNIILKYLRKAGRNIDGKKPGRRMDMALWVPLLVLMIIKNLNSREMAQQLSENVVFRIFVGWQNYTGSLIRDHANIAKTMTALGEEGVKELNDCVLVTALQQGYTELSELSADTTCQEVKIGYPNEPGILRGLAQRAQRCLTTLCKEGKKKLTSAFNHCASIIKKCKGHHLFAKTQEKKQSICKQMVKTTVALIQEVKKIIPRIKEDANKVALNAGQQLNKLVDVGARLIPQIEHWLDTGSVAAGKILHAGLDTARAIPRGKLGKKVEFGYRWLICRLKKGYIFGQLLITSLSEFDMPEIALNQYQDIFGAEQKPELFVYDRGASSQKNRTMLKSKEIKDGIQPKGKSRYRVHGQDRKAVMSARGMTEGVIGTMKSEKNKFNKTSARSETSVRLAGQRSICSMNMNKLMRDTNSKKQAA